MQRGDGNLFLAAERFLVRIAAVALAEQSDNLFQLVSLLLHFEDLVDSNPLTRFGLVFSAAVRVPDESQKATNSHISRRHRCPKSPILTTTIKRIERSHTTGINRDERQLVSNDEI